METLNDKIATAEKYQPTPHAPVVDRTEQVQVGLDWAARQANRPPAPPEPTRMPVTMPIAN